MTESKAKNPSSSHRYISFSLAGKEYAIPLLSVKEVIAIPEITLTPFSPAHFLGITNLRGQIIPIMDLRLKMGFTANNTPETVVIICDLQGINLGIMVDSVNSVISPESNEIAEAPDMESYRDTEYILGIYKQEKMLTLIIDLGKLLDSPDFKFLKSQQSHKADSEAA